MKIVLAGASGLLGSALKPVLVHDGHELVQLVRHAPRGAGEVQWDPYAGTLDLAVLESCDAVINLAGAGVGDKRWTPKYKLELRTSRVDVTRFLATTLASLNSKPGVLLNGSAVGIYGNRGDEALDETSAPGRGFLADLCVEWEAATKPASDAGIRVVNIRTGYVLTPTGGFLGPQLLPTKLGINGPMGGGKQYQSWIHLDDWINGVRLALVDPALEGPVNLSAPHPARQKEVAHALGAALHRPSFMPVPGFALKLMLGEFSAEVLDGAKVLPAKLENAGYSFAHPDIDEAVKDILSRA